MDRLGSLADGRSVPYNDEVRGSRSHADAWAEYLRWCEHFNYRPVSEREFAQERNLYR